ncbi:hypothetical protein ACFE04_011233 [Oxalis oulophora]
MERAFGHDYSRELGDNVVEPISKMEFMEMLATAKVESGIVTIFCGLMHDWLGTRGHQNKFNFAWPRLLSPLHEDKKTSYDVDEFLLIKDLVASWAIREMKNR